MVPEETPRSVATRFMWFVAYSVLVLAMSADADRLWGLFSLGSFAIALAATLQAHWVGRTLLAGPERREAGVGASASQSAAVSKWSWLRLAEAYEVLSVGLVTWAVTAGFVGVGSYMVAGGGSSWMERTVIGAVTAPAAFIWPPSKWPPPTNIGFGMGAALVKRRATLALVSMPSAAILAFIIDRLLSEYSRLSLLAWVGAMAAIVLIVAISVWIGRYLRPPTTRVDGVSGWPVFEQGDYSTGRLTRNEVILTLVCAAATFAMTAIAFTIAVVPVQTVSEIENGGVHYWGLGSGSAIGMTWVAARWPLPTGYDPP